MLKEHRQKSLIKLGKLLEDQWRDNAGVLLKLIPNDRGWSKPRRAGLAVAMTCPVELTTKLDLPRLKSYFEAHGRYLNLLQEHYPKGDDVFKVPRDRGKKLRHEAGLPRGGPGLLRQNTFENICCALFIGLYKKIQGTPYHAWQYLAEYFNWRYSELSKQLEREDRKLMHTFMIGYCTDVLPPYMLPDVLPLDLLIVDLLPFASIQLADRYGCLSPQEYNQLKNILARNKKFTAESLKVQVFNEDITLLREQRNEFDKLVKRATAITITIRGLKWRNGKI